MSSSVDYDYDGLLGIKDLIWFVMKRADRFVCVVWHIIRTILRSSLQAKQKTKK